METICPLITRPHSFILYEFIHKCTKRTVRGVTAVAHAALRAAHWHTTAVPLVVRYGLLPLDPAACTAHW